MTAHRRPEIRFSDAERGTCRWCGEPIVHGDGARQGEPDRRRRWHPECVDAYNASDPREARRRVRKRDRGLCAACGVDTRALRKAHRGRGATRALREQGYVPRRSLWELDHIVPLIDGGSHDLANLQTLCTPCHRTKTASEARERATRERALATAARHDADTTVAANDRDAPDIAVAGPDERAARSAAGNRGVKRRGTPRPKRDESLAAILERATRINDRVESLLRDHRAGS